MNLLEQIGTDVVCATALSKKITIGGETKIYPVYKISLDKLFYNDQNDRIATWISQYNTEGFQLNSEDEDYNNVIEKFIVESNPQAIKATKKNIQMVNQREPGVVLQDGRIIDGNRRFTCLRQLFEEGNTDFGYFEAVILDKDISKNKKQIKLLELMIQHGEESKIDYNPIDKLVGIYNDIIKNELITVDEYVNSTNSKKSEVNKKIEEAKLMVEFLEYINANEKFYIARDLQLDGPLVELISILKKTDDEYKQGIKFTVFNMLAVKTGDSTREVRKLKKVVNYEKYVKPLVEKQEEIGVKIIDIMNESDDTVAQLSKLSLERNIVEEINRSVSIAYQGAGLETVKDGPLVQVEKAKDNLSVVDLNIIARMEENSITDLKYLVEEVELLLNKIKEKL